MITIFISWYVVSVLLFLFFGILLGRAKGKEWGRLRRRFYLGALWKFLIPPLAYSYYLINVKMVSASYDAEHTWLDVFQTIFCVNYWAICYLWLPNVIGQFLGYRSTGLAYGTAEGCCYRCGYPLGPTSSVVCPDCGFVMPDEEALKFS